MRIFIFENLIYMKIYSLLILNNLQYRKKNNVKAPKKTKLAICERCILSCEQVCLLHTAHQISDTDHLGRHDQINHLLTSIAAALNRSGGGGGPLQHRMSTQRWAVSINMWPNAVGTFKRPLPGV